MKMALSEFVLREKGIYGILHVIILILSLFLVISISVDTFKGIPFYEQSVYMKVQLWICALFLADFVLEWFLAEKKKLCSHTLHFPTGSHTLSKYHCLYGMDFLTGNNIHATFYPVSSRWVCHGYCGGVADIQPCIRTVRLLSHHAAGYRLFFQPGLLCHGAWSQSFGQRIWRCFVVGIYGRDNSRLQYHSGHSYRTGTVRTAGCAGHDDVSYLYSVRNKLGRTAQQGERRVLQKNDAEAHTHSRCFLNS